jgi:thioredoxin 1
MTTSARTAIVAAVALLAAVAVIAKRTHQAAPAQGGAAPTAVARPHAEGPLPRLLDLGSGKCVPCRMMEPILDELEKECAGRMRVDFIDVFVDEGAVKKYDVNVIPTQIFYGADGKELGRNEGFISKEDILAKWKELGVDLGGAIKP